MTEDSYCSMVDGCIVADPADTDDVVKAKYFAYFKENFLKFYETRTPMHIFTHAALFQRNRGSFEALVMFLQEVMYYDNIWMLSPSQVIDFMSSPVSYTKAMNSAIPSWRC
ncbi:uncharacterized protein LOC101845628 [Aplysia californica]|uniref:Uncharacterized protein LOC101845628 n=1 Tax=Aplysia californica TaxID=6500 RepID=A0ABM1A3N7_APLCA|nr:uncharacterized protein LOC101845628 [Aplysia californica]